MSQALVCCCGAVNSVVSPSSRRTAEPGFGTAVAAKPAVEAASICTAYQRFSPGPMVSRYWPDPLLSVAASPDSEPPLIFFPLKR